MQFKIQNFKILSLILGALLVLSLAGSVWLIQKNKSNSLTGSVSFSLIKPVSAEEIYPLFICPCCGQPLDKKNVCCGEAQERIDYIDSLAAKNIPEKEIIIAFVKKYGLNSLVDTNKIEDIKQELVKFAPVERPIISLAPAEYNFGDISQKEGVVTAFFEIKNDGKSDLIINRLDTSCGCTSASVVFEGVEGPRFAMAGHGIESPAEWQVIIPPGEKAQLKIYYDPDVHKDFRGFAIREIYIFSNDPVDFEKKVQIELNQAE